MLIGYRITENSRKKNTMSMGSFWLWHLYFVTWIQNSSSRWLSNASWYGSDNFGCTFHISFHLRSHNRSSGFFVCSRNSRTKYYANRNRHLLDVCINHSHVVPHLEGICFWQQSWTVVCHFWIIYLTVLDNKPFCIGINQRKKGILGKTWVWQTSWNRSRKQLWRCFQ